MKKLKRYYMDKTVTKSNMSIIFGTIDSPEEHMERVCSELKQIVARHRAHQKTITKEEKRARKQMRQNYNVRVDGAIAQQKKNVDEEKIEWLLEWSDCVMGRFDLNKGPDGSVMQQEFAVEIPERYRYWEKNQTR
jgi:hypothetical protein